MHMRDNTSAFIPCSKACYHNLSAMAHVVLPQSDNMGKFHPLVNTIQDISSSQDQLTMGWGRVNLSDAGENRPTGYNYTHHVCISLAFVNFKGHEECKCWSVLFKKRARYLTIETMSEVADDVPHTLIHVTFKKRNAMFYFKKSKRKNSFVYL